MRHTIASVVSVVAVAAIALAACRGPDRGITVKPVATPRAIAAAASHTASAATGHVQVTMTAPRGGDQATMTASGAFDAARHRFALSIDLAPFGAPSGATVDVVADGDTMYFRSPLLTTIAGATTPWINVHADASALSPTPADPGAFLDLLQGVGGPVTSVGRGEVRGVPTDRVRATVRLRDAIERAPAAGRERLQQAIERLDRAGDALLDAALPVDVDIDDEDLVRKVVVTVAPPPSPGSAGGPATVTLEFFDLGAPVSIEPPPTDQVTDLSSVAPRPTSAPAGG